MRPHLHDPPVLALRVDQQLAFVRVVPARLLDVNMLPRLHREQRGGRVPVVGRRDHQGVHVFVLEGLAKVAEPSGRFTLYAGDGGTALGQHDRIHVFMPMTATVTFSPGEPSHEESRGEPTKLSPAAEAVFMNLRRFIDHAP